MKTLFVTNDLSGLDGYSTYTKNLLRSLNDAEQAIASVAVERIVSTEPIKQYKIFSASGNFYLWQPWRILKAACNLQRVIFLEKPNNIHFIVEPYQLVLAFMFIPKSIKVFVTVHGTYAYPPEHVRGYKRWVGQFLYRLAHRKVTAIIAVSKFTKQRYVAKNDHIARPVTVRYNITSLMTLKSEEIPNKTEPYHAITVGEVKRRKGIKESIIMLSSWAQKNHIQIVYDVVGLCPEESGYVQEVKEIAKKLQHDFFQVKFYGRVSEGIKLQLLRHASVYLHLEPLGKDDTLAVEGFGIGIIDAAAYGVPAIASRGTATAEAVEYTNIGYLVNPTDTNEIHTVLTKLFT